MIETFAPRLPFEVRRNLDKRMCDAVKYNVEAHFNRDSDLVEAYEAWSRIAPPTPNRPNENSCNLIDPIVFSHGLEVLAPLQAMHAQNPLWLIEAVEPDDDESAQRVEKALTHRARGDGFTAALYDADYICLRDQAAPMYIGWSTRRKNIRTLKYREKGAGLDEPLIDESERREGIEYEPVPYLEPAILRTGFDYEVSDRANFYMDPPDINDVEGATWIGTRMYFTAHQLLEGITRYNFDEEAVYYLLEQGATGVPTLRGDYPQAKSEVSGTSYTEYPQEGVGLWELFRVFGKLPIWTKGGGLEVPDYLQNDEFLFVLCPRYDKLIHFGYSPFAMRPFTQFRFLREPNGQGGESIPTMTMALQDESTAVLRSAIDSENLRARPSMKVLASNDERFGTQVVGVGTKILCERSLNEFDIVKWDHTAAQESMLWINDCRGRGRSLVSGEGFGQLSNKQRKNAEIEAALAGVSSKFALYGSNIQGTGMERAALIHLSHLSQFGGNDPYKMNLGAGKVIEVQPDDWKKVYAIKPRGSANDADPAVRMQRKMALKDLVMTSPIVQQMAAAGDMRPFYHLLREVGGAIDDNFSVEAYVGPEPPPPDQLQLVAQVMGQIFEQITQRPGTAHAAAQMFLQNPAGLRALSMLIEQAKMEKEQPGGMNGQGQQGGPMQAQQNGNGQQPAMSLNGVG